MKKLVQLALLLSFPLIVERVDAGVDPLKAFSTACDTGAKRFGGVSTGLESAILELLEKAMTLVKKQNTEGADAEINYNQTIAVIVAVRILTKVMAELLHFLFICTKLLCGHIAKQTKLEKTLASEKISDKAREKAEQEKEVVDAAIASVVTMLVGYVMSVFILNVKVAAYILVLLLERSGTVTFPKNNKHIAAAIKVFAEIEKILKLLDLNGSLGQVKELSSHPNYQKVDSLFGDFTTIGLGLRFILAGTLQPKQLANIRKASDTSGNAGGGTEENAVTDRDDIKNRYDPGQKEKDDAMEPGEEDEE
ncbi:MAG: hypothetical protein LBE95_00490 [Holosporaceae bacterium]|jgi:hypothetical protein|nr:hypothetical protein [Holosporaceae bacterium]